jgi:hypothetical protein
MANTCYELFYPLNTLLGVVHPPRPLHLAKSHPGWMTAQGVGSRLPGRLQEDWNSRLLLFGAALGHFCRYARNPELL